MIKRKKETKRNWITKWNQIKIQNLNGKQTLWPEKGIYSYLVKFYRTIDTLYAEYTGLFRVSPAFAQAMVKFKTTGKEASRHYGWARNRKWRLSSLTIHPTKFGLPGILWVVQWRPWRAHGSDITMLLLVIKSYRIRLECLELETTTIRFATRSAC